jgi:3-deoxy-D-manno-octulosonate 8-phosphate phosphatase (KDO 8-P phosphatase)
MERLPSQATLARFARVKLFLCDVDGVLTDASVYIGEGVELKRFNILDGLGLRLLQHEGIEVGWVSNRPSPATRIRAKELKVDHLCQQKGGSKVTVVEALLSKTGLSWADICYVGDDIVDLGVLKRAGVAVAVANAIAEVKAIAHYITRAGGGHGAVRECVELILKSQGKWPKVVAAHSA